MKYKEDNLKRQAEKNGKIVAQDVFNSYAFISDPDVKSLMDNVINKLSHDIHKIFEKKKPAYLWVDGSYNPKTHTAGVGIIIITDPDQPINNTTNIAFGKTIKAKDSLTAEIYALSIGLSYILDTFQDITDVFVKYDCVNSTICATNIDAHVAFGAPYTNFKSALKRIKKRKMNAIFEHTKAHAVDPYNTKCDLLARYYSKVKLSAAQNKIIHKLISAK